MFKSSTLAVLIAVPVLTNADCGSCNPGASTPDPGVTPTPDPCEDYVGQATRAELDATPRARPDLEALAIHMDGTFTARQDTYDRLVADTTAAGTLDDEVAGVGYRSPYSAERLLIGGSSATLAAMADGSYTAWDCANDWYGVNDVTAHSSFVVVELPGTYDMLALAEEYSLLPQAGYAEPDGIIGGGSSVCANRDEDGETWHYVYDIGWGDCPSGCIHHRFVYFTSDPDGTVIAQGSWSSSAHPATRPSWVSLFNCP